MLSTPAGSNFYQCPMIQFLLQEVADINNVDMEERTVMH